MCLNIEGFLRNSKFPRDFRGMFRDDSGRQFTPDEARDHLWSEVHAGHKVIPCSSECANPCKHADRGCAGFDYAGGGCPGYSIDNEARDESAILEHSNA
ncbi:MAG: hypothetical protein BGP24_14875 [Lysobacterales bacterium 69-70]|nr:MAG: hypothetical protein ABS97_05700 [Xanthomonadaceae bacterium SCN 69-320]ODV16868.1 MAG: hypothetical protein ABT27_19015 [Xanthomonadaceae bacterium SCN 69-25]OJY94262.1 MAG: hypothetical protein BGP24_14875 [Xanthomonadales bacterium 69-70]